MISHQYRTVACTRIRTSLHGTYIPASPSSSNVCPLSCTHNKPEKIAYANKSNLTTFFTTLVSHIVRRQVMTPAFQSFMYNYELRRLWSYTDSCIITRLYADSEEPFFSLLALLRYFTDRASLLSKRHSSDSGTSSTITHLISFAVSKFRTFNLHGSSCPDLPQRWPSCVHSLFENFIGNATQSKGLEPLHPLRWPRISNPALYRLSQLCEFGIR